MKLSVEDLYALQQTEADEVRGADPKADALLKKALSAP